MYGPMMGNTEASLALAYERMKAELFDMGYQLEPFEIKMCSDDPSEFGSPMKDVDRMLSAVQGGPQSVFRIFIRVTNGEKLKEREQIFETGTFQEVVGFARGLLMFEKYNRARGKVRKI